MREETVGTAPLTGIEVQRYSRQMSIFGREGQEQLKRTGVFIAGAGGLGSAVAVYVACAGFGKIVIADCDKVELSNLNRQILHTVSSIGRMKVESAREAINAINPGVEVEVISQTITKENVLQLTKDCDLIMDCMDSFEGRYLLNRSALRWNVPLFHGAISGFFGQATTIIPGRTACFKCLFPLAPQIRVSEAIGATCGIIGGIQVTEAVKYAVGRGELLENRLLLWDGQSSTTDVISFEPRAHCPDCGQPQ